ncbi:SDR family NAD(P)-dependent oxidoreductase [Occultella aeris]|uniref:3-oxoacyl-[acyl-carrier-protein] reductase FabG n=1 Tax=Occultella aeris TaxID=2761496 RepID=A0A7M4DGE9_9MICO|nr:SDR family oxidoreductase [Occultella aeris]VZO35992.1 3-oxoacyl-[acyl-carrier-protein] reductase FabG [Occultella aeris]
MSEATSNPPLPRTLEGRHVIVTGGGVGIGLGIVRRFAAAGARVALTTHSRSADDVVAQLADEGLDVLGLRFDATDSEQVTAAVDLLADRLGGLDVVVNNSGGLLARHTIAETSDVHWDAVWRVNVSSTFYVSRAALRHLGEGGRIINISSLAGSNGGGNGSAPYATAKAAVDGFTRALAKEIAPHGITVNAIAPGLILDTPFHETFTPPADQEKTIASIPVGRAGFPDDVAAAAEYFARDDSAFVTGTVLDLNGGVHFS